QGRGQPGRCVRHPRTAWPLKRVGSVLHSASPFVVCGGPGHRTGAGRSLAVRIAMMAETDARCGAVGGIPCETTIAWVPAVSPARAGLGPWLATAPPSAWLAAD